jgi:hypothetical protein
MLFAKAGRTKWPKPKLFHLLSGRSGSVTSTGERITGRFTFHHGVSEGAAIGKGELLEIELTQAEAAEIAEWFGPIAGRRGLYATTRPTTAPR